LLNPLVQQGKLALDDRNTLLESMTEEVAQDVLHNNNIHGRQLSLDSVRSKQDPFAFSTAIQWVCTRSSATRAFLRLPSEEELQRRQSAGKGLTRPELAVLAAHIKMHVFKDLLKSDESLIADFDQRVMDYFPQKIQEGYANEIANHMLRPSIGMTMLLNEVVGEAGVLLFPTLMDITGASALDIARAWLVALETIGAGQLREDIAQISNLRGQYHAWTTATKPLFGMLSSWLFAQELPTAQQQSMMQKVLERLPKLMVMSAQEQDKALVAELQSKEVPVALAEKIVALNHVTFAYEIAKDLDASANVDQAIVAYLAIGDASLFMKAIDLLDNRRATGGWDAAANAILRSRFFHLLKRLTQIIDLGPEMALGLDRIAFRLRTNHLSGIYADMQSLMGESIDLAALVVANARAQASIRNLTANTDRLQGTGHLK